MIKEPKLLAVGRKAQNKYCVFFTIFAKNFNKTINDKTKIKRKCKVFYVKCFSSLKRGKPCKYRMISVIRRL